MSQRCGVCHAYGWHTEDCPVARHEDEQASVEAALQRNDMARVIMLALSSQGYIQSDNHGLGMAFLRELEECGYTLRLTTAEERREKNRVGESS